MYRYSGERNRNTGKSAEINTQQTLVRFKRNIIKFYPRNKKWKAISLSFETQLALYGEVEKDLFFDN